MRRTLQVQRKSGVQISFETDLSEADARAIVLNAAAAGQNVGDFAHSLATQRRALTANQSAWLIYLAMEIGGQLRQQVAKGPWAWLLVRTVEANHRFRIIAPPATDGMPAEPCRWLLLRRAERFVRNDSGPDDRWRYVGRIDAYGGFHFARELLQQVSGEGRSAMRIKFPDLEASIQDEAKWLQYEASQILEGLKHTES